MKNHFSPFLSLSLPSCLSLFSLHLSSSSLSWTFRLHLPLSPTPFYSWPQTENCTNRRPSITILLLGWNPYAILQPWSRPLHHPPSLVENHHLELPPLHALSLHTTLSIATNSLSRRWTDTRSHINHLGHELSFLFLGGRKFIVHHHHFRPSIDACKATYKQPLSRASS